MFRVPGSCSTFGFEVLRSMFYVPVSLWTRTPEPGTPNLKPKLETRTWNPEPGTPNSNLEHELGTWNRNVELRFATPACTVRAVDTAQSGSALMPWPQASRCRGAPSPCE